MYQDVEYAGICGSSIKVFARERPSIPAARKRGEEIVIPGMDGVLYKTDKSYEPTEIKVPMNYIGEEEKWAERWRAVQKWLSVKNSILRFSDDDGYFFRISKAKLSEAERPSARVGRFEVTFITKDGLYYLNSGLRAHKAEEIRWNPYEVSKPVYRIKGEGSCSLRVNGNEMTATVEQNLTIDTERQLAYEKGGGMRNTSVTGDYENLWLIEGENSVEISEGFQLEVIPNWRCR